jgi:MYXO-CTERM domain-containing protein
LSLLSVPSAVADQVTEIDGVYMGILPSLDTSASTFTLTLGSATSDPLNGISLANLQINLDSTIPGPVTFGTPNPPTSDNASQLAIGPGLGMGGTDLVDFTVPGPLTGGAMPVFPPGMISGNVITVSMSLQNVDPSLSGSDFSSINFGMLTISGMDFAQLSPGGPIVASWDTIDPTPVVVTFQFFTVPEPATSTLALSGLLGLAGAGWLRRRKQQLAAS